MRPGASPLQSTIQKLFLVLVDDRFHLLGVALHGKNDCAFFHARRRNGKGRKNVPTIGKAEPKAEGTIRPEGDRLTLNVTRALGSVDP